MNDLKNELKKRKINSKESLHSLILDLYHGKNQAIMVRTLDIGFDIIKNNGDFTSEIRCKLKLTEQFFYPEDVANKILNIWINLIDKNQNSSSNQNSLSKNNLFNYSNTSDRKNYIPSFSKQTSKTVPPRYSGKRLKKWFLYVNGKEMGPFEDDEINNFIKENRVVYNTPIWKDGMSNWVDLEVIEEFMSYFEITFNNKMIDKEIRKKLNVNKNYKIRKKDLLKITELYLAYNKILDLSTLKFFKNLKILKLHNNEISNLSALKELEKLTTLYLQNNNISDISALKELKKLTILYLENNNISDISALKELKKLTELDLHNNNISDISALKKLKDLKILHLENNNISDIYALKELKKLTMLYF